MYLLILYGIYPFAARRLAYRNDYCLRCDGVRLAELVQTFDVGHLFFVPLLPLGRRQRWHCSDCGSNPHERVAASQKIKKLAAVAFALFTIFFCLIPITGPEDAPIAWSLRIGMFLCFLAALAWCRTAPPPNLKEQLSRVPPLPKDACVFCRGPLDIRCFCGACKLTRLDVPDPRRRSYVGFGS